MTEPERDGRNRWHGSLPVHVTPKVEAPLTSWWLDIPREDWPVVVAQQMTRWTQSALARRMVPAASVPMLAMSRPRRGPL